MLDQVQQGEAAACVALGDRHHEAQIGLGQLALGGHVAPLDAPGQGDLLAGSEQRHAADLAQVEAQGVARRRAHGEIELRCLVCLVTGLTGGSLLDTDELDVALDKAGEKLLEGLFRQLQLALDLCKALGLEIALRAALLPKQRGKLVAVSTRLEGGSCMAIPCTASTLVHGGRLVAPSHRWQSAPQRMVGGAAQQPRANSEAVKRVSATKCGSTSTSARRQDGRR